MSIEKKERRKKPAKGLIAGGAAVAILAAGVGIYALTSGDDEPDAPADAGGSEAAAAGEPISGGTLRYLAAQEPPVWYNVGQNPLSLLSIQSSVFDSLLSQASDGSYHAGLADLPEISDDGLEYTFTLREGVTFHDGEPLNAEALAANIDRIFLQQPGSVPVDGVEVLGEYEFSVSLSRPHGALVHHFSTPHFPIVSPAVLAEHDNSELIGNPIHSVGTGPFKVVDYVRGSSLTLERNEDYNWAPANREREGAAYLDTIEISFVSEPEIRVNSLLSGQADVIDGVPPINASEIEGTDSLVILEAVNAGFPYSVQLNTNVEPFDDVRVREAVRSAIDVESILESVYDGYYEKPWSVLSPNTPPAGSYNEDLEGSWSYDPDAAETLLAEAGFTETDSDGFLTRDGERLTLHWKDDSGYVNSDQRAQLNQAIAANLRDVGIEVEISQYETSSYKEELAKNEHHLAPSSRGYADAGIISSVFWSNLSLLNNVNGINYGLTSDPSIDEWSAEITTSTDQDRRAELAGLIQQQVHDEVYAIPLYVAKKLVGAHDYVEGWEFDAVGYTDSFYDVWLSNQ